MKNVLPALSLLTLLILVACGDDNANTEAENNNDNNQNATEEVAENKQNNEEENEVNEQNNNNNNENDTSLENNQSNQDNDESIDEESKENYMINVQPSIILLINEYDYSWDYLWVTTFNGLEDGLVDENQVYNNMVELEARYDDLFTRFNRIPTVDSFSNTNNDYLNDYKSEMQSASMKRSEAAVLAAEMFDSLDMSPSKTAEIEDIVNDSDIHMMEAISIIISLEKNLDLGLDSTFFE